MRELLLDHLANTSYLDEREKKARLGLRLLSEHGLRSAIQQELETYGNHIYIFSGDVKYGCDVPR